jgi:hypothetical protein
MQRRFTFKEYKIIVHFIRKTASVVNLLILVPYGVWCLIIAFSGDYSPWSFAPYGFGVLVLGGLTAYGFAIRGPVAFNRLILAACAPFHVWLLIHSIIELFDKPVMVSWSDEIVYSAPVVVGPLVSLLAVATLGMMGWLVERHDN